MTLLAKRYDGFIKNIYAKTSPADLKSAFSIKLNKEENSFTAYSNTALYSPVPYIAQSAGIFAGKFFNLPPLALLYLGRVFNLILYILLGYCALKVIPAFKIPVFLILLMPMSLSLAASLSADASLIAVSVLFTAFILKIYSERKSEITSGEFVILCLLSVFLALAKQYVFLAFLVLILPVAGFRKWLIVGLSFLAALWWSVIAGKLYTTLSPGAEPVLQAEFILHNPFKYIFILLATFVVKFVRLVMTGVGILGWQDTRLDFITYITYPLLLAGSCFSSQKLLSKADCIKVFIISVVSCVFLVTLVYLSWNKTGAPVVMGLNGKYFTPVLLPLIVAAGSLSCKSFQLPVKYIYCYRFLVLFSAICSITLKFYTVWC